MDKSAGNAGVRPADSKAALPAHYDEALKTRTDIVTDVEIVTARTLWLVEGLVRAGVNPGAAVNLMVAIDSVLQRAVQERMHKVLAKLQES